MDAISGVEATNSTVEASFRRSGHLETEKKNKKQTAMNQTRRRNQNNNDDASSFSKPRIQQQRQRQQQQQWKQQQQLSQQRGRVSAAKQQQQQRPKSSPSMPRATGSRRNRNLDRDRWFGREEEPTRDRTAPSPPARLVCSERPGCSSSETTTKILCTDNNVRRSDPFRDVYKHRHHRDERDGDAPIPTAPAGRTDRGSASDDGEESHGSDAGGGGICDDDDDCRSTTIDAESFWCCSDIVGDAGSSSSNNNNRVLYDNDRNNGNIDSRRHGCSSGEVDRDDDPSQRVIVRATVVGPAAVPFAASSSSSSSSSSSIDAVPSYRKHGWIGIGIILFVSTAAATGIGLWKAATLPGSGKKKRSSNGTTAGGGGGGGGASSRAPTLVPTDTTTAAATSFVAFPWESMGAYHESLLEQVLDAIEDDSGSSATSHDDDDDETLLRSYVWSDPESSRHEALLFVAYRDGSEFGGGDMGYYHPPSSSSSSSRDESELDDDDGDGLGLGQSDTSLLLQRLALLTLYYETGGDFSWIVSSHRTAAVGSDPSARTRSRTRRLVDGDGGRGEWATPGVDECSWDGVICDDGYRVVELVLSGRGLRGSGLPSELWAWLPYLRTLDVSGNRLSGPLPSRALWPRPPEPPSSDSEDRRSPPGRLQHLTRLDFSSNEFDGNLPEDLGWGLASLQVLNLADNLLAGPLPERYRTGVLQHLRLASNKLTGSLPFDEWFRQRGSSSTSSNSDSNIDDYDDDSNALVYVDLEDNLLTGSLPTSLGDHPNLEYLSVKRNPSLGGSLPPASVLAGMTALEILLLSDCGFDGSLTDPLAGLLGLPSLRRLGMSSNRLTGSLPSLSSVAANANADADASDHPSILEALNLGNNGLTGTIPRGLMADGLTDLEYLHLFGNQLTGTVPTEALFANRSYPHRNKLSSLWLHNNPRLGGTMPCPSEYDYENENGASETTSATTSIAAAAATAGYYDYTADCKIEPAAAGLPQGPRVECSCCRRCY